MATTDKGKQLISIQDSRHLSVPAEAGGNCVLHGLAIEAACGTDDGSRSSLLHFYSPLHSPAEDVDVKFIGQDGEAVLVSPTEQGYLFADGRAMPYASGESEMPPHMTQAAAPRERAAPREILNDFDEIRGRNAFRGYHATDELERGSRFLPGWWILPGMVLGGLLWAMIIVGSGPINRLAVSLVA